MTMNYIIHTFFVGLLMIALLLIDKRHELPNLPQDLGLGSVTTDDCSLQLEVAKLNSMYRTASCGMGDSKQAQLFLVLIRMLFRSAGYVCLVWSQGLNRGGLSVAIHALCLTNDPHRSPAGYVAQLQKGVRHTVLEASKQLRIHLHLLALEKRKRSWRQPMLPHGLSFHLAARTQSKMTHSLRAYRR